MLDMYINDMIKDIRNEFSVLGHCLSNYKNDNFMFYLVNNWETSSFSPNLLLPNRILTKNDLQYIEDYFLKFQWNNKAIKKIPYFNFINIRSGYDYQKIKQICDDNDWYIEPEPLRINFLKNSMKIELPKELDYSITKINNGILPEDYKDTIKQNFNADDEYIRYIENAFRQENIDTHVVMVTDGGKCVAGGAVSFHNNVGFMTWGSVNKAYRNKGIHQVLLAVIKGLCEDMDIESCAYTTRNQLIINKCDYKIEMMICRKRGE